MSSIRSKVSAQEYGRYLIGIVWRKRRWEFLNRHRWCEECHIQPAEQVHHLSYANVGNEPDMDLLSVCRRCHANLHGIVAANDNQPELPLERTG